MPERRPKERGHLPRPSPALDSEDIWEFTNKPKGKGVPVRSSSLHHDKEKKENMAWPGHSLTEGTEGREASDKASNVCAGNC